MRKIILISIAITLGCAAPQVQNNINIPGDFVSYAQQFEVMGNIKITNLIIQFAPVAQIKSDIFGGTVIGYCDVELGTPTISIDKDYWENASNAMKLELLFHEMGHCVLHRGHTSVTLPDGTPASIMNPTIFNEIILTRNYNYYIHELFSN